jgi:2-C-methyl-D-erythritol 4-phosphate cytidylyltransferase
MLAGQPMVMHTLAAFAAVPGLSGTMVVVSPGDAFLKSGSSYEVAACGGASRAASVANGLTHLAQQGAQADDWVLVHDAARCLITSEQVSQLIKACRDDAVGGLLALPLPDTLKSEIKGRVGATVDRSDKWLAQTPQMFRLGVLRKALAQAGDQVTDESSAVEALGLAPRLVTGSAQNFKLTYAQDFALAQAVLQSRQSDRSSP